MQSYADSRRKIVQLQSVARGFLARNLAKRRMQAICRLQESFRAVALRRNYAALRRAALVVQRRRRAAVLSRRCALDHL